VALPIVERTGDQVHCAVGFEDDLAKFGARRGGNFEIGADRDAAQLAALAAVLLAFAKPARSACSSALLNTAGKSPLS
jgi:hypothetical protein